MSLNKERLPVFADISNTTIISVLDDGETWGSSGDVLFLTDEQIEEISEGNISDIDSEGSEIISISISELLDSHFKLLKIESDAKNMIENTSHNEAVDILDLKDKDWGDLFDLFLSESDDKTVEISGLDIGVAKELWNDIDFEINAVDGFKPLNERSDLSIIVDLSSNGLLDKYFEITLDEDNSLTM